VDAGYLYVPASYRPEIPLPLVLALHGAGGNVSGPLALLGPSAEALGFLILAVHSSDYSWDGVLGSYGPDVASIDTALRRAFARCRVDAARLVIEGFSDGASYALGLGLANGNLFTRIVAFSPGFLHESDTGRRGRPELFISHGRQDTVLPIDGASRQLVPRLQAEGYTVTSVEFDGGHGVPPDIAQTAVTWLLR
jgi:phospholipase/carboxylesterase